MKCKCTVVYSPLEPWKALGDSGRQRTVTAEIEYCPLHKAAPEMLAHLKWIVEDCPVCALAQRDMLEVNHHKTVKQLIALATAGCPNCFDYNCKEHPKQDHA